jgi:GNAT superfamily N-acetyltransferase
MRNGTTNQLSSVQIRPVTTDRDAERFLDLPAKVYANDPHWVSPLRSSVAKQFEPSNHFFQYGRLQRFIAVTADNQAVGRIVAAVNDRLIEREGRKVGLFGFFECIDDAELAKALLDVTCDWLRQQGMDLARGPIDLSTNKNCFSLVDGFDSAPYIMMPYNPPYYPKHIERAGWHKAKDAYAYDLPITRLMGEFEKAYLIACKAGVTFRSVRTKGEGFQQDCVNLLHLFTEAFADSWSSSPHTEAEFIEEAQEMRQIVDPSIFWIAEHRGKMVGFFMALPDYNMALRHVRGKLDLIGILKLLWYRRKIDRARVFAICALPDYRRKMVAPALIYVGAKGGFVDKKKPYRRAELSWVFEDNILSRRVTEASGAKIYKTYRVYEKELR